MKATKKFFYAIETTGKAFYNSSIHHLSGLIDINGQIVDKIDLYIRPDARAQISTDALNISGVALANILQYPEAATQFKELERFLSKYVNKYEKSDKLYLCGFKSAGFGDDFLSMFFTLNNSPYFGSYFYSGSLDVMTLAAQYLIAERENMLSFTLEEVARRLGIYIDQPRIRDARYVSELCYRVYQIVTGRQPRTNFNPTFVDF